MSQYMDALAAARQHARALRSVIFAVTLLGMFSTWLAWRTPKTIDVNLVPSITADSVVTVKDGQSDVPAQNVYAFGYYIWQQLNRWNSDGSSDYAAQIKYVQPYVTPQCQAQLEADEQARNQAGELKFRTRTITEIPGFGYAPNRVVDEGGDHTAWTVFLDAQVQETFRGAPVKDIFVRYPIRVVRYDVDRERNPWQLAIDCFGKNQPARLDEADLHKLNPLTHKSELKVPALPGAVEPAQLPQATPLDSTASAPPAAASATDTAAAADAGQP